jgi:hypothetical protein
LIFFAILSFVILNDEKISKTSRSPSSKTGKSCRDLLETKNEIVLNCASTSGQQKSSFLESLCLTVDEGKDKNLDTYRYLDVMGTVDSLNNFSQNISVGSRRAVRANNEDNKGNFRDGYFEFSDEVIFYESSDRDLSLNLKQGKYKYHFKVDLGSMVIMRKKYNGLQFERRSFTCVREN